MRRVTTIFLTKKKFFLLVTLHNIIEDLNMIPSLAGLKPGHFFSVNSWNVVRYGFQISLYQNS